MKCWVENYQKNCSRGAGLSSTPSQRDVARGKRDFGVFMETKVNFYYEL